MTSIRNNPPEEDHLTYPTVVHGRIVEMTGAQRRRLVEQQTPPIERIKDRTTRLEERVLALEQILMDKGWMPDERP